MKLKSYKRAEEMKGQLTAQLDVVDARIKGAIDAQDWQAITDMLNACRLLSRKIVKEY